MRGAALPTANGGVRRLVLCICTCGRPAGLERVLRAVDALVWPEGEMPSFAVLVVDNLPDGRARAVVERLRPAFRWPLHFVEEPERGISQARNRAVAEALALGAEFVAFVDDDDVPRPDWLWWLWKRQRETGADIVFGSWEHVLPPNASRLMREFMSSVLERSEETGRVQDAGRAATRNVLLRRGILEALRERDGYVFDPAFSFMGGGDTHMFLRGLEAGARGISEPGSVVRVNAPRTFGAQLRRQFRYGVSRHHITRRMGRQERSSGKVLLDAMRFAIRALFWPSPGNVVYSLAKLAYRFGELRGRIPGEFRYYGRRQR